jgi:DNA-binding response OmpR family regulator
MFRKSIIMVVDDQEQLRMLLRDVLNVKGLKVLVSGSGEDALWICRRFTRKIDMLITDVELPQLSGFDLADLAVRVRPAMAVLFTSGGFFEQDREVQERLGPRRAFLEKPFNMDKLVLKVESLLAVA